MYLINFEGETVIHADTAEQAAEMLQDDMNLGMGQIEIKNVKELD